MSSSPESPEEGEHGSRSLEIHRRIHAKPKPPSYKPITVSDALRQLRRSLESGIVLGLHAFIVGDEDAAMGIVELERSVDEVAYQLLAHVSIAVGHHIDDATKAAPIYTYVLAVDKVMDSLKDLASLIARGHRVSEAVRDEFIAVDDEPVVRLESPPFRSVGELMERYGVDVIAIKRRGSWIFGPGNEEAIESGDTVYIWGSKDSVNELLSGLGAGPLPEREEQGLVQDIISSMEMLLVMNELAHYQLRAQDPVLAEEILELEMFMDSIRERNSLAVIASELSDEDKFLLLSLVTRIEDVSDSLTYIIAMPAEEEYREILSSLVEAGGERVALLSAEQETPLRRVEEELEDLGVRLLALRRGKEWVAATPYNVARIELRPGDALLVEYEKPLEEKVLAKAAELGLRPARQASP